MKDRFLVVRDDIQIKAPPLKELKKFMDTMVTAYQTIENVDLVDRFFSMSMDSMKIIKVDRKFDQDEIEWMARQINGGDK